MSWQFDDDSNSYDPFQGTFVSDSTNHHKPNSSNPEPCQFGVVRQAGWYSRSDGSCTLETEVNSEQRLSLTNANSQPSFWSGSNESQNLDIEAEPEYANCRCLSSERETIDRLCAERISIADAIDILGHEPPLRSGAKVRERRRMLSINSAFEVSFAHPKSV
ncbi:hypothetical protein FBUS_08837 [Fasciolopsis buskii]|uniref:Uncharacterized protein n=1 Tax=Fasciolopsis buskii TaxID=27845 RepID=A0A8E0S0Q7_9TREM|nr:hypothetical protein FBUS_08837 [Fasciolopsis buski]